jgi:uncharacterized membrane protein YdfJ with MMPL/SSD domain
MVPVMLSGPRPGLPSRHTVRQLGFAVAFGVLLDTLVVRSVLVTALNLDLGRWIWWPSKLYRQTRPQTDILNGRAAAIR